MLALSPPARIQDATHSSLTVLLSEPFSTKLPRLRVLRLRPKYDFLAVFLSLPTLPPTQNRIIAMKKQVKLAQVKPYAYLPRDALWPDRLRALRPRTVHALGDDVSMLSSIPLSTTTHVMSAAATAWEAMAKKAKKPVKYAPRRATIAATLTRKATTEKKRAMT